MKKHTRFAFNAYLQQLARLNNVEVEELSSKFTVEPSVQQTLEDQIQQSTAFLTMVNVIGVAEQSGQLLGLGVGSTIAGTTDTTTKEREPTDPTEMVDVEYKCEQTNFDTVLTYAKLDMWAKFQDFQVRIRNAIVKRQALDRIMIGFNGVKRAKTSDRAANPLLQDVNKGWLQKVREDAPDCVMGSTTAEDGTTTADPVKVGKGGKYANLDALVYAQSGDLSFVALGKNLGDGMLNEPLLLAGFGLMIVGLGFKLSLVPFHLWTPDVYQGAPAPVSTFLATASKIAIFGVVMRLFLYAPVGDSEAIRVVLAIIAFASIIFGNLMALSQTNIKRLLGYSSISHLGYLLVALIALQTGEMSMEAVGVYLVGYLFSSLGAFGVVSLMSSPYRGPDADSLFSYRGLFWHRPILAAVMTVMMLSLAGIPMTLGFIGKFYVLAVGVQAHLWWLVGAVVVGSAIGLYYYLRVAVSLYLHAPEQPGRDAPSNWQYSAGGIVVLISALLVLVLGVWPQPLISIVRLAMPLM